ncbi:hypothetical protein [Arthrobacter gengyunqii]|uniref:Uncharacterized protein n=1 Tax=Arthrobacter gengyunqii TaxID=2886940 RepID=A0ABS8GET9_9MICC|nr:hypothetical protein [Arthrobacter gengyunqii]MCC3264668.1 hypothetical protein [Arthrobacter gengyunqii]
MATKITFVIDNPTDPDAFESAYKGIKNSAKQLPKLRRYEACPPDPGPVLRQLRRLISRSDDHGGCRLVRSIDRHRDTF